MSLPATLAIATTTTLALLTSANACTGGPKIKGTFAATISGPVIGGNSAESFTGVITADGKCALTGTLTGGIYGQSIATATVTGTYTVPKTGEGTITLTLPNTSAPVSFDTGAVKDGKTTSITGIATNGSATATLDMAPMAQKTYTTSSLAGTYVATCTGAANDQSGAHGPGVELVFFTFDGSGNVAVVTDANDNGNYYQGTITGSYTVASAGTFTIGYPGSNSRYVVDGEITAASGLRAVFIDTMSGFGAYRGCIMRPQA